MGDHDDGDAAFARQLGQQAQHGVRVQRVQGGGGLVRQHHRRAVGQGRGNGHALAFAHGQGGRVLVQQFCDAQTCGHFIGGAPKILGGSRGGSLAQNVGDSRGPRGRKAQGAAAQQNIFLRSEKWQQTAGLQHIAQVAQAQPGQSVRAAVLPGGQHVRVRVRRGREGKGGFFRCGLFRF